MVQILRNQVRNYTADQSSAIQQQQMAANIGEITKAVEGISNIYDTYKKEQEAADANIIATQYGKTAHNATIGELDALAEKYGAHSDKFKEEAYALAERNYAPQIEGMSTQKYKTEMETKLRGTKDYIDVYQTSARAKKLEERKAQVAADKLVRGFGDEAYQQGTRQEYSDITGVDDYVNYASKKTGVDKEQVKAAVQRDIAMGRMLGILDTDIVTGASALGDKEVLEDYFTTVVNNDPKYANASDSKKEKAIKKLLEDETRTKSSDEHLKDILGDKYLDALEKSYTKGLSEEKVRLQNELASANPKSARAESLKKKLADINKKIDSVDEKEILNLAREQLKAGYGNTNGLGALLKQRYAEFKQQMKVDSYNNSVYTLANAMDPDPLTAQQARWKIWASQNKLIDKQSTEIGEWETKNSSSANPLMSPIKDEVNVDELASSYQQYIKNSETVKPQLHENYVGTMAMHDALQELWNTPDLTPIQAVALGYKAVNAMYDAPITEDQRQTFNNLVVRAIQDRGFGDLAKSVLHNSDRYYPDTNWMENAFGGFVPESGEPEGGIRRTDVTNVKRMIDDKTQQAINSALHQMVDVAYLPREQQIPAFQKISDDLVSAKKAIFDEAMQNYGIDLPYLDQQLNTKGKAYARIGFVVKEYKGRDDKGMPLFEDAEVKDQATAAKKILDLLLGLDKKGEE